MLTNNKYQILAKKYGSYSSWAIWDYDNPGDTSIIDQNIDKLHSKFVLLGLNISRPLTTSNWVNFHSNDHARKLKYACNVTKLRGAYMTDIFKGVVAKSTVEFKRILKDEEINRSVEIFNQEMKDIAINSDTQFILFGKEVEMYFNKYFNHKSLIKPIYHDHYSAFNKYSDREWVTSFWKSLNISENYESTIKNYKSTN